MPSAASPAASRRASWTKSASAHTQEGLEQPLLGHLGPVATPSTEEDKTASRPTREDADAALEEIAPKAADYRQEAALLSGEVRPRNASSACANPKGEPATSEPFLISLSRFS